MRFVFALLVTLGVGTFIFYEFWSAKHQLILNIGPATIRVEVADDAVERQRGLSGRKSLKPDEGLLFIFEEPGIYPFWMKEMNFPIDIIWIKDSWLVADTDKNIRPESFPRLFQSRSPIKYVLEVAAGFVEKNNIRIGEGVEAVNLFEKKPQPVQAGLGFVLKFLRELREAGFQRR